ncbi:unnamed protein product, partial [Closterium sp. Yama58-4]
MGSKTAVAHSPGLSPSDLPPDLDWPLAALPALRSRGLRSQFPGESRSFDRERILSTTDSLGLSPRRTRVRRCSPSASPQSAEGSWAEAVAAGRRKHSEHATGRPALSPLRSGFASALLSPPSENTWRPAALTAVRGSPLGGSARHDTAPASVDMEQLWAEAASDKAGGAAAARRTRKNRIVRGRARNMSFSDFSSLRGALGEEKAPGTPRRADAAFECRVIGWSPCPPPWDGEAPPVSAEPPQQESGAAAAASARPSITNRRPAATAAIRNLKLRIFPNRGRDESSATASSPSAAVVVSPPATTPASACVTTGTVFAASPPSRLEGPGERVPSPSLSMKPRNSLSLLRGAAGSASGAGGAGIPKSPSQRRGLSGVSARRRSFSGEGAAPGKLVSLVHVAGTGGGCDEPATVVPFVREEEDKQEPPLQGASQKASKPTHMRSRSGTAIGGEQHAAEQEIQFRVDLLCGLQAGRLDGAAGEMTTRSCEADGEESRGQTRAAASYHETMDLELEDYFGDIVHAWNMASPSRG